MKNGESNFQTNSLLMSNSERIRIVNYSLRRCFYPIILSLTKKRYFLQRKDCNYSFNGQIFLVFHLFFYV